MAGHHQSIEKEVKERGEGRIGLGQAVGFCHRISDEGLDCKLVREAAVFVTPSTPPAQARLTIATKISCGREVFIC
jgi:hypothetical protein